MDTTEDFFSRNHLILLNFATWAKFLAWATLVLYIMLTGIQIIQLLFAKDEGNIFGPASQSVLTMLMLDPLSLFEQIVRIAMSLLKGGIYFLVLKGVSLGLNMIVETDINYRDSQDEQ